jgi:hypothetical protein
MNLDKRNAERRDAKWFVRSEKLIVRGIALLAAVLVLAQLALHFPAARQLLSRTEHWEGTRYVTE